MPYDSRREAENEQIGGGVPGIQVGAGTRADERDAVGDPARPCRPAHRVGERRVPVQRAHADAGPRPVANLRQRVDQHVVALEGSDRGDAQQRASR